jgi:hypothetical protein
MGKLLKNFDKTVMDSMIADLGSSNSSYYVFGGYTTPWLDDNNPPAVFENLDDSVVTTLQTLVMGKRIYPANVRYLAKRHNWSSNTVYSQYDNTDYELFTKAFFVLTDENKVYKCLYNNKGIPSTTKPTLTQNTAFTTADGYTWKWMFTINSTDMSNHSNIDYYPITPNTDITTSATDRIEVIELLSGGSNYQTVHSGTVTNISNTTLFQIANSASISNEFYANCAFYVDGGPGAGSYSRIVSYTSNSLGKFVALETAVANAVSGSSTYQIAPRVVIDGDGSGAKAILTVTNTFVVNAVSVINGGSGYTRASAVVAGNNTFGSGATLKVYVPPIGGHGADPVSELGCTDLGFYATFANNEGGSIITECSFRRYGLLKNPMQAANTDALYTTNTFNQVLKGVFVGNTVFSNNEVLVGANSNAKGTVVWSNSSIVMMVGDKDFINGETLVSSNTGVSAVISISTAGDLAPTSPQILYVNNSTPNPRSNTTTQSIRFSITL